MEAPSTEATWLLRSQLCHVLQLLTSHPPLALQRQAFLTCAAVLQRQGHEVAEEYKELPGAMGVGNYWHLLGFYGADFMGRSDC